MDLFLQSDGNNKIAFFNPAPMSNEIGIPWKNHGMQMMLSYIVDYKGNGMKLER